MLQRPGICYIFEKQGVLGDNRMVDMVDMYMADMEDMDIYGHVEHGRDGHGCVGHKDKYKDKDKYNVLRRPNVCYIFVKHFHQFHQSFPPIIFNQKNSTKRFPPKPILHLSTH